MNIIKRTTYSRIFRKLTRSLHLSNILRKWYYLWSRPRNKVLNLEVSSISGQFYIQTPGELRILESMGGGGCGEQRILEILISYLRPKDVFYDIGSHVGLYTVFLAKAVGKLGKVIAFEPEKQNYEHLLDNVKLNHLRNVYVFQRALGDREEERKLYLGEDTGNASLVRPYLTEGNYELVKVVKGDLFVKENYLPMPRVVKIDVEGYEYNVIKGLHRILAHPTCELVCCEVHPTLLPIEVKPEVVLDLLKSLGFGRINFYPRENEYHMVAYKTATST